MPTEPKTTRRARRIVTADKARKMARVVALRIERRPITEISRLTGVPIPTVYKWTIAESKRLGIVLVKGRKRIPQAVIDGIVEHAHEGVKLAYTAAKFGVSVHCVFYWRKKLGLVRGRAGNDA